MTKFRSCAMVLGEILAVTALGAGVANGQTLQKRGGTISPEFKTIYDSPEYNNAYHAAELTYSEAKPDPYIPFPWNPKKHVLWVGNKQKELGQYTLALDEFKDQLDNAGKNPQIRNDPEKLAQLSQIQNRLIEDNLSALNTMVKDVDLKTFYNNNHSKLAELWAPWQMPGGKPAMDDSGMEKIYKFIRNIETCLGESENYYVQFSKSSKFSDVVPMTADGKQMSWHDSGYFWLYKYDDNKPVDAAIVTLYGSLHQAQMTAAKEGLLSNGPENLRAVIVVSASDTKSNSTLLATHP